MKVETDRKKSLPKLFKSLSYRPWVIPLRTYNCCALIKLIQSNFLACMILWVKSTWLNLKKIKFVIVA